MEKRNSQKIWLGASIILIISISFFFILLNSENNSLTGNPVFNIQKTTTETQTENNIKLSQNIVPTDENTPLQERLSLFSLDKPKISKEIFINKVFEYNMAKKEEPNKFPEYYREEINYSLNNVYGLSATLSSLIYSPEGFARVIGITDKDEEILVFGTDFLFLDGGAYSFDKICEETCVFDKPINLKKIRIELYKSELNLDRIQYKDSKVGGLSEKDLRELQQNAKLELLQNKIASEKLSWTPGKTPVSSLKYSELKKLFLNNQLGNLEGFQYYIGGIFSLNKEKNINKGGAGTTKIHYDTGYYLDNLDYRKYQGKNWMTSVKTQGNCGSCWAHAAVGAVEGLINLYFNNESIDQDLSEQQLVSCCTNCGNCNGGLSEKALDYISIEGLVNETCFPYVANNSSCNLCANNQDRWKIYNETRMFSNYKNSLFENGTMAGFYSLHVMTVAGYGFNETTNKEYVLYKNSWGEYGEDRGYVKIEYDQDHMYFILPIYPAYPTYANNFSIICQDNDHDGYCYWGVGDKPRTCSKSCNEKEDFDDSDSGVNSLFDVWISSIDYNQNVRYNEYTTVTSNISFIGEKPIYNLPVYLKINGNIVDQKKINISNGQTIKLKFEFMPSDRDIGSFENFIIEIPTDQREINTKRDNKFLGEIWIYNYDNGFNLSNNSLFDCNSSSNPLGKPIKIIAGPLDYLNPGIFVSSINNSTLKNCNIIGFKNQILITNSQNIILKNNKLRHPINAGFSFGHSINLSLKNNSFEHGAINFEKVNYSVLEDNIFINSQIKLQGSSYNNISHNNFSSYKSSFILGIMPGEAQINLTPTQSLFNKISYNLFDGRYSDYPNLALYLENNTNCIYHNSFYKYGETGMPIGGSKFNLWSSIGANISCDYFGNYWDRNNYPYFCEYGNQNTSCVLYWDSNRPDVVDPCPYNQSYAPGQWPESPICGCKDSDGLNYYNKGNITYHLKTYNDTCVSQHEANLLEYHCINGQKAEKYYFCQNSCSNGACDRLPRP